MPSAGFGFTGLRFEPVLYSRFLSSELGFKQYKNCPVLCNNLATAILPTSKETEIQEPCRIAIIVPEDENECRGIIYLAIRTERANPKIRPAGALLATLKHVSSVMERAAWHLAILLESERLHASDWREFLPGNEPVEKRRQPELRHPRIVMPDKKIIIRILSSLRRRRYRSIEARHVVISRSNRQKV